MISLRKTIQIITIVYKIRKRKLKAYAFTINIRKIFNSASALLGMLDGIFDLFEFSKLTLLSIAW